MRKQKRGSAATVLGPRPSGNRPHFREREGLRRRLPFTTPPCPGGCVAIGERGFEHIADSRADGVVKCRATNAAVARRQPAQPRRRDGIERRCRTAALPLSFPSTDGERGSNDATQGARD